MMRFLGAVNYCLLQNYANLNGRAGRAEFWWFMVFCVLAGMIASVIDILQMPYYSPVMAEILPVNLGVNLLLLIPNIAATSRRLHDVGRSGKWQFIAVTIIGIIPLLYWLLKQGDAGANRFGPPPV